MARPAFQKLRIYRLAEDLSDAVWDLVLPWAIFAKDTTGKQLVRSADSIGANIAEGVGRGACPDQQRFVRIARGSLNETIHFLRRAYRRKLITKQQVNQIKPLIDNLGPQLNSYLQSISSQSRSARGKRASNNGQHRSIALS